MFIATLEFGTKIMMREPIIRQLCAGKKQKQTIIEFFFFFPKAQFYCAASLLL